MGAMFTFAVGTKDVAAAAPAAVAHGMGLTFAVAAALVMVAMVIARAADWRE
jgi:hypothetical protein